MIGTEKEDKDANCSTTRPDTHNAGSEQCCENTGPERCCSKANSNPKCCANTGNNSNLNDNNNNAFIPMDNSNDIDYFTPGTSQENDRRASVELRKQLQNEDLERLQP